MYHINKGLSSVPTQTTDHSNFLLVRKDCLNERDDFVRREGTTNYALAGWRIRFDKDG